MTPLPAIDPADLPELRPAVLASQEEYDEFVRSMPDHGTPVDWNWLAATGWQAGRLVTTAPVNAGGLGRPRLGGGGTKWEADRDGDLVRLRAGTIDKLERWLYVEFYVIDGPACRLLYAVGYRPRLPVLDNPTRGQVRALMDVLGA